MTEQIKAPDDNPNQRLTPFFDGDEVIWIPICEWYARNVGSNAVRGAEVYDEKSDSAGA